MGERKIPSDVAVMMIVVAVLLDFINIGLDFIAFGLLGWVIDAIATMVFGIWFSHFKSSLWSSRNVGRTLVTVVIDAVPLGDLTFPWTAQVAYTAFTERVSAVPASVRRRCYPVALQNVADGLI
jgi:hypothetical protein